MAIERKFYSIKPYVYLTNKWITCENLRYFKSLESKQVNIITAGVVFYGHFIDNIWVIGGSHL